MKVIEEPRLSTKDLLDAEALIKEARQHQRKRRLFIGLIVLMAVAVSGVSYAIVSRPIARAGHTSTSSPSKPISPILAGAFVSPKAPYALAVAPNHDLLVVDSGRDQILRYLPTGKFQVVAGDGKRGFSGDGGPAVRAEVNLDYQAGIAVAKNGTIYFSDAQNGRVREVLSDGIIETVAGGGTVSLGIKPVAALSAKFDAPWGLFGLAIGPNGELYIGANAVYRLGPNDVLYWVVGKWGVSLPKNWHGAYSNPAIQSDFTPAVRIAFDGKGDLLVAGGGGFGLYEMTSVGKLRFVENLRGDGYWGSLAAGPGGSVVLASRAGIFGYSPSGAIGLISPSPSQTGTFNSPLSAALGAPHEKNGFIPGDGVAVGRNGEIYVDTNAGNGWTSVSAILELRPNGKVVALCKS